LPFIFLPSQAFQRASLRRALFKVRYDETFLSSSAFLPSQLFLFERRVNLFSCSHFGGPAHPLGHSLSPFLPLRSALDWKSFFAPYSDCSTHTCWRLPSGPPILNPPRSNPAGFWEAPSPQSPQNHFKLAPPPLPCLRQAAIFLFPGLFSGHLFFTPVAVFILVICFYLLSIADICAFGSLPNAWP